MQQIKVLKYLCRFKNLEKYCTQRQHHSVFDVVTEQKCLNINLLNHLLS